MGRTHSTVGRLAGLLTYSVASVAIAGATSCGDTVKTPAPIVARAMPVELVAGNVLLVIADDLGLEQTSSYGHPSAPQTPTIDALARSGVRFDNAYVTPFCSPTRAAMLTGRLGRRTGMGKIVDEKFRLSPQAPSIARIVQAVGYATSLVGKWHLAGVADFAHPGRFGFEWFAGTTKNPQDHTKVVGGKTDYSRWEKNVNGKPILTTKYMTTDSADDAIARIKAMPEPWFLWLAFNAPHYPAHAPPRKLHKEPAVHGPGRGAYKYRAMIQALDTEFGRLLAKMDPEVRARTTVIFMADNGTPDLYAYPPKRWDRVKGNVFEGGIRVPLIVSGPLVNRPGSRTDVFVEAVDFLPTIAELAGADVHSEVAPGGGTFDYDGRSFLPWVLEPRLANDREYVFAEQFALNGPGPHKFDQRSIRDADWKLIRTLKDDKLFRLHETNGLDANGNLLPTGLDEGPNLLPRANAEQKAAYQRLKKAMNDRIGGIRYEGY